MVSLPAHLDGHAQTVIDTMGTAASLTIGAGFAVPITAAIRTPGEEQFTQYDNPQQGAEITLRALWSDVSAASKGDQIEQGGVTYRFAETPLDNGYGIGEAPLEIV